MATALAIGTGVAAYGDWDVGAEEAQFTVHAASIPRMKAPIVELPGGEPQITAEGIVAAGPRIAWDRVTIAPGTPVQRYVVTRHLGPIAQVACDVPAARARCVDESAPAGYLATYTVAATYGTFWTGEPSPASEPALLPGEAAPIVVDGVVLVPGADGSALVPAPGVSASAPGGVVVVPQAGAADGRGQPEPVASTSTAPAPDQVQPPPVQAPPVHKPPAPPEESAPAPDAGKPSSSASAGTGKNDGGTQKDTPIGSAIDAVIPG
ncbi:hypothetical protein COUCH_05455 [Couchioplanes caeruleus]|uniref:hypothetical protein n=1 Tax=Couchioplanes caeruleus TaxID=56438 RepID=UPI0020BF3FFA|nr:hypothetical protein [Couchioplanes caeruleus]UQU65766.1 hypothetical protein COUCH_05455 [Couchioplanes caeruleus]